MKLQSVSGCGGGEERRGEERGEGGPQIGIDIRFIEAQHAWIIIIRTIGALIKDYIGCAIFDNYPMRRNYL